MKPQHNRVEQTVILLNGFAFIVEMAFERHKAVAMIQVGSKGEIDNYVKS